jgi:hypothetical protein
MIELSQKPQEKKENDIEYKNVNSNQEQEKNLVTQFKIIQSSSAVTKEWILNEEILSKIPQGNYQKIKNLNKNLDVDVLDQIRKSGKMSFDDKYFSKVNL